MTLDEYRRKRSFGRTPEPPPKPSALQATRFYVQRHHARRLHYDLRLEANGTLKSWAVPKGPTLDPEEKRLAVLVEDHPIDYGSFEGTIPQGNYGAGTVIVWDSGHYELIGDEPFEQQMERGDLKFSLHGQKLLGSFALVRIKASQKKNEWLLIKKKDFAATPGWNAEDDISSVATGTIEPAAIAGAVRSDMPREASPMMAVPSATLPQGPEWLFELKWDGVRALCFLDAQYRLFSRTGNRIEKQYPELANIHKLVAAESAILDGELVVLDDRGRPSFSLLQSRLGAGESSAAQLARSAPVTFLVFDLLYLNGYDLRSATLADRKHVLQSILRPTPVLRFSEHFAQHGEKLLQFARDNELEGVVAKRANSLYESKRSPHWLKVKVVSQQDFVICGYTSGGRDFFGSLALGVYENPDDLVYAGNVGSGFDEKTLARVSNSLQPLKSPTCYFKPEPKIPGKTTWLRPERVCTVRFSSWTKEGRLRAPVFLGLRDDVGPHDCVREKAEETTQPVAASQIDSKLLPPKIAEAMLSVEGRQMKFTNLNKVFYPKEGYTKRDVINYYDAVSAFILPHLQDRPLSLKRYPNGIEGKFFFQKEAAGTFPSWLKREPIFSEHNRAPINFVIANDRSSLLYLANLGCIDQNPWMSRVGSLESPDFVLIDLDPSQCGYDRIIEAAQLVRRKLDLLELEGFPKTTGGDGMHIYIPIETGYTYEHARTFAEILARIVAHERPDLFTTPRTVSQREKGKVYFDYLQISTGKTISAPYVLRAYAGAPVSTPLQWSEITRGLTPAQFHLGNALDRFSRLGDLFAPVLLRKQRLENALEKLGSILHRTEAAH